MGRSTWAQTCWQFSRRRLVPAFVAVTIYLCYGYADRLASKLGRTGTNVILKLSAFLSVCIGVQILWNGASKLLSSLPQFKGNGEDVKVVQELLRHSTAKMTLDTYTQALSPQKRAAESKVVGMIRPKPSCTVVVPRVSEEIPVTH